MHLISRTATLAWAALALSVLSPASSAQTMTASAPAASQGGGARTAPAAAAQPPRSAIAVQVSRLSEERRRSLFARSLREEGQQCPSVTNAPLQGVAADGTVYWSVSCEGGRSWQLSIKPTATGDINFVDCDAAAVSGMPACFTRVSSR